MNPDNSRTRGALLSLALLIVLVCLGVTVWNQVDDEFAKGVLTLVLGRMLGYVDLCYNFEFGTTRSSTRKDETIQDLTKTAAVVANTAQATQVAADVAAAQPAVLKAEAVAIDAETVTVESPPKGVTP
jgi:hypothetical protein